MTDGRDLTDRQRQILDYINAEVRRRGFPPERARDRRGGRPLVVLHRAQPPGRARGQGATSGATRPSRARSRSSGVRDRASRRRHAARPRGAARGPGRRRLARSSPPRTSRPTIPLPDELADDSTFILKVKGDSMIEAGIFDGDFLVVHQQQTADNGDIVVAMLGDEATVKTVLPRGRPDPPAARERDDGADLRDRRDSSSARSISLFRRL